MEWKLKGIFRRNGPNGQTNSRRQLINGRARRLHNRNPIRIGATFFFLSKKNLFNTYSIQHTYTLLFHQILKKKHFQKMSIASYYHDCATMGRLNIKSSIFFLSIAVKFAIAL